MFTSRLEGRLVSSRRPFHFFARLYQPSNHLAVDDAVPFIKHLITLVGAKLLHAMRRMQGRALIYPRWFMWCKFAVEHEQMVREERDLNVAA